MQSQRGIRARTFFASPNDFIESLYPAVKGIVAVIADERILFTAERESPVSDAICIAADQSSEIRIRPKIAGEIIEAEHDIRKASGAVWRFQTHQPSAIGSDLCRDAARIAQREQIDVLARFRFSPVLSCQRAHVSYEFLPEINVANHACRYTPPQFF